MQLPGFDEFLTSIDPAEFDRRYYELTYGKANLVELPPVFDPGFRAALDQVIQTRAVSSLAASMVYLRMYHEWLSRYLEDPPNT